MPEKDFNFRDIFPVFLTAMIDFIGFGIIIPIAPYYLETFGGNAFDFSILLVVYSGAQFIASPFLGRISDYYGRKRVLSIGLSGEVAGYLVFALAPYLLILYIGRIITGATSGNLPVLYAFVSDKTSPSGRTKAIGLIGAAIGIGFVIGPAIGGILSVFGYRVPIFFAALLSVINLSLVQRLSEGRTKTKARKGSIINAFKVAPYLFLSITAIAMGFVMLQTVLAFYGQSLYGWGSLEVGLILAMVGIEQAVFQIGVVPALVSKLGTWKVLFAGIIAFTVSFGILSFENPEYIALLALTIFALGYSFFQTPVISYISQISREGESGANLGITQSAQSLASIIAPLIAGYLFYYVSKFVPFEISAVVGIVSAALVFISLRQRNGKGVIIDKTQAAQET